MQSCIRTWTWLHYIDVLMTMMSSQITSLTFCLPNRYSGADKKKHQIYASLAFVRGIYRWPVNSRTKGQQRGKCFHLMTSSWAHFILIQEWHVNQLWLKDVSKGVHLTYMFIKPNHFLSFRHSPTNICTPSWPCIGVIPLKFYLG